LIETAQGVENVRALAAADSVQRLYRSIDLQADLGYATTTRRLLFPFKLVLASRLADLAATVDGVNTAIDDVESLQRDTARARRLGSARSCASSARSRP